MLLEIASSFLLSSLLLQLWHIFTVLRPPLLNLRFLVVVLVVLRVLVACKVANKEGPRFLLCLLFSPLNDPLSLLLPRLVPLHIFPVLVALEVLCLFL